MRVTSLTKDGKLPITEKAFTAQVIQLARYHGWLVAHFRAAQDRHGRWKTAVQGDGAGFPDLVLARFPQVLFVELKTDTGTLSDAQKKWLDALDMSVWRPSDWDEIQEILK